MATHGEPDAADGETRGRMLRALRDAATHLGKAKRVSGLSLIAVLCASAVAPVTLVGPMIGTTWAAWLATAGSIGSNVLADVIIGAVGRRSLEPGSDAQAVERAVAAELEVRMAEPGPHAAALRGAVAVVLREHGAQQVLLEALTVGDVELQGSLAESMTLLVGHFDEFAGLLRAVRDGVWELQQHAHRRQAEDQAQAKHRDHVEIALGRISHLLQNQTAQMGAAGVVYSALPPDTSAFTGRRSEISEIARRAAAAATQNGAIGISAITGMPGVGKSALAVHVAHLLADRYPDRQLFVDLHAHTEGREPADPATTLVALLTGDGLDSRQLPTDLPELSALWRSRMAGRRALLVLDNAASSAQIAPLLPGGARSLVLVTSRRHLGDLRYAVTEISLDLLSQQDAVAMFLRLAPRAAGREEQVARLVSAAGLLPLAIGLLARLYMKHRTWSISELIEETRARLLTLSAETHTVAAAFELSYQALPGARQQFFRLLSLHPGSDVDPYAAAALTGTSPAQATGHLDALHGDHLVTEPSHRRYGMHDLIRAYGRARTEGSDPSEQRAAAVERLLRYYAHTAQAASVLIARVPRLEPDRPAALHTPTLQDPDAAQAWLHAEQPNLEAAIVLARSLSLESHAVALSAGLADILHNDGPWNRAVQIHEAAAEMAQRLNRPIARATALTDLGRARYLAGDIFGAEHVHAQALEIYRQLGDHLGEANTLTELGRAHFMAGDFPRAAKDHMSAVEIYRRVSNRHGEANALTGVGRVQYAIGRYPEAVDILTQALTIYRQIGDRQGEAYVLTELGVPRYTRGDLPGAADVLEPALEAYRRLGNRLGEAGVLVYIGRVKYMAKDFPGAEVASTRALEISRQIGYRQGEANALTDLGLLRYASGDFVGAEDAQAQSLEIYRQTGHRGDEASALNRYAATIAATGDRPRALALFQRALAVNRELNKPDDEAISLEGIAEYHLTDGSPVQGAEYLRLALQLYRSLGMRPDIDRVTARLRDASAQRTSD